MSKVMNAADENQVQAVERKMKEERRQELNDLRTVLSSESGRRLVWRILTKCKTFGSVWDNSARIHYNSGQQDLGHFIMAEVIEADEALLFKMMKESKKRKEDKE